MLSRVLIKGEKFGRAAWEDREAKFRQQMHNVVSSHPKIPRDQQDKTGSEKELKPRKDVKIVAIDLQPISPLPGIITLRADITHPATVPLLVSAPVSPVLQSIDISHTFVQ